MSGSTSEDIMPSWKTYLYLDSAARPNSSAHLEGLRSEIEQTSERLDGCFSRKTRGLRSLITETCLISKRDLLRPFLDDR